jgi:hypothetical protein
MADWDPPEGHVLAELVGEVEVGPAGGPPSRQGHGVLAVLDGYPVRDLGWVVPPAVRGEGQAWITANMITTWRLEDGALLIEHRNPIPAPSAGGGGHRALSEPEPAGGMGRHVGEPPPPPSPPEVFVWASYLRITPADPAAVLAFDRGARGLLEMPALGQQP